MAGSDRPLVIVGAGGMGREALAWLQAAEPVRRIVGFVDEDGAMHGSIVAGLEVLGGSEWLADHDVDAVLAVGSCEGRARLDQLLAELGRDPVTVVHPTAVIGPRSQLGTGSILAPHVTVTTDVAIGRATVLNYGSAVGHDSRLGAHCFIGPGAHLGGFVEVGERVWIGIGASVLQHVSVGEGATVGGGAMVVSDVPSQCTVVGVPARVRDS